MKFKLILFFGILMPFLSFAQNSSKNSDAIRQLISAKQYDAAIDKATQILDAEQDEQVYVLRAKLYHQVKNYSAEITDYKKLLDIKDSANVRLSLARAYLSIKDTIQAKKTVELNLKLYPDHIPSYAYLAVLESMAKNTDLALKILNDAYKKYDSPMLLMVRASEYRRQGKYDEAFDDYETLISRFKYPSLYFAAAQNASDAGNYKKTVAYYKKYLEKNPNSSAVLNNVGRELQKIGNFTDAEIYYKKAVELSPKNVYALSGQAILAYKKGNTEEAFNVADASLLFNSKAKVNFLIRGYLNSYEGNLDDAEADFKEVFTDTQQKKYAYNAIAKLYIYKGEYAKAVEFASQAMTIRTDTAPEPYNIRGFAYYKMGNMDAAVKDFVFAKSLKDDYQPVFNYVDKASKQPVKNYIHIQFLQPFNDVNECKTGFYTDGKDDFDFKIRIISNDDVDASKIQVFEDGNAIDSKYWSMLNVNKRSFKLMDMIVTDVAFHYIPKSRKSYLKLSYAGSDTQTLILRK